MFIMLPCLKRLNKPILTKHCCFISFCFFFNFAFLRWFISFCLTDIYFYDAVISDMELHSFNDRPCFHWSSLSFSTGSLPTFKVLGRSAKLLCSLLSCRTIKHFSGDHFCWCERAPSMLELNWSPLCWNSYQINMYSVHIVLTSWSI